MTPTEYLNLGKYHKRTTFGVRSLGIELKSQPLLIDPYIFGLWIGDGDSTSASIAVNTKDVEIIESLKNYCSDYNFDFTIRKTNSKNCIEFYIKRPEQDAQKNSKWTQNKFTLKLKKLNVHKNKHLPKEYLNNSYENRLKLLAGLLDSDGHLAKPNNSYSYELANSNKEIVEQYNFLARSLGFKVRHKQRRSNLNTDYWVIYISGDLSKIPCRVKRKRVPESYIRQYADHINKIDVKPIGNGKFYGITLEANNDDDRRLILEDFTISMNCGKFPREVPFSEYWSVVKTSHRLGSNIVGKAMVVSTVNSADKGGREFKKVWDASDPHERNQNNQTQSGLYRIFIPAKYCLEGFFDEFGFSIVEDPEKPMKNELGKVVTKGAATFLSNEAEALKGDPEKYNEFLRQFPNRVEDAFRDESADCAFNLMKLTEQIDYNRDELNDRWATNNVFVGNDELERGNFHWKNGIEDSEVIWRPNPEGRFFLAKGCHPPQEYRSRWEEKFRNGIISKTPLLSELGTIGIDPYNRTQTSDGRGSQGAIHLTTKQHTVDHIPNETLILEYIDRPRTIEMFFEDAIMAAVYFSVPFLCELSNERFLAMVKQRGYRNYSMNNPLKSFKDLNPTEKEFGGFSQQAKAGGDAQFYATELFIEDRIGVARDSSIRQMGEMAYFPFTRTLYQLKETDPNKRTDYDAYIAFSLSLLGNQKRIHATIKRPEVKVVPFQRFDNSGVISKAL